MLILPQCLRDTGLDIAELHSHHLIYTLLVEMDSQLKTEVRIGTHDGTFHCAEVLACVFLKMLPEYCDAEIVRTRDQGPGDSQTV